MRSAGIHKSHDLWTYISWSTDFGQMCKVKIFVQGRILSSTNGSKLIFHMRMYSMRPAGIYKSHDLMTYISRTAKFRLWPIFHG